MDDMTTPRTRCHRPTINFDVDADLFFIAIEKDKVMLMKHSLTAIALCIPLSFTTAIAGSKDTSVTNVERKKSAQTIVVAPLGATESADPTMTAALEGIQEAKENIESKLDELELVVELDGRIQNSFIAIVESIEKIKVGKLRRALIGVGMPASDARESASKLREANRRTKKRDQEVDGRRVGNTILVEINNNSEAVKNTAGHEMGHLLSDPALPPHMLIEGATNYYSGFGYKYFNWDYAWRDIAEQNPEAAAAVFFQHDDVKIKRLEEIVNRGEDRWAPTREALLRMGVLSEQQYNMSADWSNWEALIGLSEWSKSNNLTNDNDGLNSSQAALYIVGQSGNWEPN